MYLYCFNVNRRGAWQIHYVCTNREINKDDFDNVATMIMFNHESVKEVHTTFFKSSMIVGHIPATVILFDLEKEK